MEKSKTRGAERHGSDWNHRLRRWSVRAWLFTSVALGSCAGYLSNMPSGATSYPVRDAYPPLRGPQLQQTDPDGVLAALERDLSRTQPSHDGFVHPEAIVALALSEMEQGSDADALFLLALATLQGERVADALLEYRKTLGPKATPHLSPVLTDDYLIRTRKFGLERTLLRAKLGGAAPAELRSSSFADGVSSFTWLAQTLEGPWKLPRVSDRYAAIYPELGSTRWIRLMQLGVPLGPRAAEAEDHEMLELLKHPHGFVRTFAAAGLAMNFDGDLAQLENAMGQDDEATRLWLELARARRGSRDAEQRVLGRARDCASAACGDALSQLLLVGEGGGAQHDEALYASILMSERADRGARGDAAHALGLMHSRGQLSATGLAALFSATDSESTYVVETSRDVIGLLSLSAPEIRRLSKQYPKALHALLLPWAKVATEEDLEALESAYYNPPPTLEYAHSLRAAAAIANIEGPVAAEKLVSWYAGQGEGIDPTFTLLEALLKIAQREPQTLAPMLDRLDAHTAKLLSAVDPAAPRAQLATMLPADDPSHAMSVLVACDVTDRSDLRPLLWNYLSYSDARSYPVEIFVRNIAVSTLFRLTFRRGLPQAAARAREPLGEATAYERDGDE